VKVGISLRGYNRALRISTQYSVSYFLVGATLIVALGLIFAGHDSLGTAAMLLFCHFWISALVFLTSLPANMVFVRLFPRRTWRKERWRARDAGALGVVFVVAGLLAGMSMFEPPALIRDYLGEFAFVLNALGWFILFSNLALLVAWAQPSRDW